MMINNIAFANPREGAQFEGYSKLDAYPLNLPPSGPTLSRVASGTAVLSGSPTQHTFAAGSTLCHFIAGPSFPIVWRWRLDGDTAGITNIAGATPYDDELSAGVGEWRAIPSGAVSVIIDKLTTQPDITLICK